MNIHHLDPIYIDHNRFHSFLKCMIHTILFARLPRLVKPKEMTLYDSIPYVKIDDSVIDRMVDEKVEKTRGYVVKNIGNRVRISLQKSIKKSGWLGISEELTDMEEWLFIIYVTQYDKSISSEQCEQMVSKLLQQLLTICDENPLLLQQSEDYTVSIKINESSYSHSPVQDLFEFIKNGPPKFSF